MRIFFAPAACRGCTSHWCTSRSRSNPRNQAPVQRPRATSLMEDDMQTRLTTMNRDLTPEESHYADRADHDDWRDARRWLRDAANRLSKCIKEAGTNHYAKWKFCMLALKLEKTWPGASHELFSDGSANLQDFAMWRMKCAGPAGTPCRPVPPCS